MTRIFTFIDGQNLHIGLTASGISLDYKRFYKYLSMKYGVTHAFLYLGYLQELEGTLYKELRDAGFELIFKEVARIKGRKPKGNVDILLAVDAMEKMNDFDQAILITSDGDFVPLLESLQRRNKFKLLISPKKKTCSFLLRKTAKGQVRFIENFIDKMKRRSADT